jgi:hypothetical protein
MARCWLVALLSFMGAHIREKRGGTDGALRKRRHINSDGRWGYEGGTCGEFLSAGGRRGERACILGSWVGGVFAR